MDCSKKTHAIVSNNRNSKPVAENLKLLYNNIYNLFYLKIFLVHGYVLKRVEPLKKPTSGACCALDNPHGPIPQTLRSNHHEPLI